MRQPCAVIRSPHCSEEADLCRRESSALPERHRKRPLIRPIRTRKYTNNRPINNVLPHKKKHAWQAYGTDL